MAKPDLSFAAQKELSEKGYVAVRQSRIVQVTGRIFATCGLDARGRDTFVPFNVVMDNLIYAIGSELKNSDLIAVESEPPDRLTLLQRHKATIAVIRGGEE